MRAAAGRVKAAGDGHAVQQGIVTRAATLAMAEVLRTRTTGENAGLMNVLVETPGDRILGFTRIGKCSDKISRPCKHPFA